MARDLGYHGEHALAASRIWAAETRSVEPIADSGNSVYLLRRKGERLALRLTDPGFRTHGQILAEVEFLHHLGRNQLRVSLPVTSEHGREVESVKVEGRALLAAVFRWAPGEWVRPGTPRWKDPFFREWGRTLAALHLAGESFRPSGKYHRWRWDEEDWIANAPRYIPPSDGAVLEEYEKVMAAMRELPFDSRNFGMVHGDLGPQNLRYAPGSGITVFDFGNCCRHWYAMDTIIALSTLLGLPREERDRVRRRIEEGYEERRPLNRPLLARIDLFLRLRALYILVSRLWKYGPDPPPEMREPMARMRRAVLEGSSWQ